MKPVMDDQQRDNEERKRDDEAPKYRALFVSYESLSSTDCAKRGFHRGVHFHNGRIATPVGNAELGRSPVLIGQARSFAHARDELIVQPMVAWTVSGLKAWRRALGNPG